MDNERTLILIKPEAVKKTIVGKILSRFEEAGLKIVACKMVWVDKEFAKNHYLLNEEWAKKSFQKTKETLEARGQKIPFKNHLDFGRTIQEWNTEVLTAGPTIALVLESPHAIELARKIVGPTEPRQASLGTIRGDFLAFESYEISNKQRRAIRNLIHASDSPENAKREIALWFAPEEIHSNYKTINELIF